MDIKTRNLLISVLVVVVIAIAFSLIKIPAMRETKVFDVPEIAVHVKGAVVNSGLYEFDASARVADAIEKAGGALENADIDAINLAQFLEDGSELIVPAKPGDNAESYETPSERKININTANETELCLLDGVGKVTARKIIDYRTQNGSFAVKEEIMNVSGIGEKTFEKIKNKISVK